MDMRRNVYMILFCLLTSVMGADCVRAQEKASEKNMEVPKVYMFTKISAENLVKIYEALGREATGKVAVKLSTGEPGGHNFLQPALIKDLVKKVNGTIVECNTAYGGGRADTENHLKAAKEHGFTAIAPVDIMDADGEVALPVKGGKHLKEDFVGSHYLNYDFTIILSHFKGHAMEDLVVRLRICLSGLLPRGVRLGFILPGKRKGILGEIYLLRMIFWNQWPRPQKR